MSGSTGQLSPIDSIDLSDACAPLAPFWRNIDVAELHHRTISDAMDCNFPDAALTAAEGSVTLK